MYVLGSKKILRGELSETKESLPKPCILLGDFNAHNRIWGEQQTIFRTREMEHIINISNLNILNTGQPTHVSGSAIDLTVTSLEIASACMWEVYPSVLSSDHHPIIVTIERPVIHQLTPESSYSYKKADSYKADEVWNSIPDYRMLRDEEMLSDFYDRLYAAADNNIPKYKPRKYFPKPW